VSIRAIAGGVFGEPGSQSMIRINCVRLSPVASTAVLILLTGCGRSAGIPGAIPPPVASRPDVTVTFDGKRRKCVVALPSEAHGSTISCADVVPFVKDELRLPSGSVYDIRKIPDVDEAEVTKVRADLNGAGYRFIGGAHE
jgi:hypothetical protein